MNYKEMMALRCAYNHGLKTAETDNMRISL